MSDFQDLLKKVRNENPYPIDIFTEPTKEEWQKVQKIFKDAGLIQDKFFGAFGRMVWGHCLDEFESELE